MSNASQAPAQAVRSHDERSGAVGAVLSFIFPGLGQAYLGRRREAVTFAVPVLLLALVLVAWLVSSGMARAGAKLLDPTVAAAGAVVSLLVVLWWAAAVITAWRVGTHPKPASVAVPLALVALLAIGTVYDRVPLGAAWLYSLSVADRGLYNNSNDPTIADAPSPTPEITLPPGATPTPTFSLAPGESPTQPPPDYEDPEDVDPSEPPPSIEAGPTPSFDITQLDAKDDGWLNVLLLGIDTSSSRSGTGTHTDTMIVVSVNTATNAVYEFSFPRDTSQFPIYTGGTYIGKLNTFAHISRNYPQFKGGGAPALSNEIGFLLGIPVDYFASINMDGFQALVDAVGGVTVCNQRQISDDHMQFYLSPGLHTLNAADALRYARSRHGSSDFARARRQQQLLSAIRAQVMQPENAVRLPEIVQAMSGVVNTNFPPDQIDLLVTLSKQVEEQPAGQFVFQFPFWATHLPREETNGRSVQFLNMDRIRSLSVQIFGDASAYSKGKPVPTINIPQPGPSDSPEPGDTQC